MSQYKVILEEDGERFEKIVTASDENDAIETLVAILRRDAKVFLVDEPTTYTDNPGGEGPRIIARVQPQVWINDWARDNGPVIEIDVTDYVVDLSDDERAELSDGDYTSDELWLGSKAYEDRPELHGHPFTVDVRDEIEAYFANES